MKVYYKMKLLAVIILVVLCNMNYGYNLKKIDDINKNIEKNLNNEFNHEKYKLSMKLINESLTNDIKFKNHAYDSTAYLVDTYGPRLMGSKSLEKSIEYLNQLLIDEKFQNVKMEEVKYDQKWIRGDEYIILLEPRPEPVKIPMLGLGMSQGGNVTAELVIVNNWEELNAKGKSGEITGKILFLNAKWENYEKTVIYRKRGPNLAAKYGAIGCIIRSITPKSMENPHTGSTYYDEGVINIPAAAISLESADMLARMITRGQKVKVNLYMEAHFLKGDFTSFNLIGELPGSTHPEEILVLGGHIDSWDGGPQTGAEDDAAGLMVCFEAVRVLIKTGLSPIRTIRFVAWTGEEFGSGLSKGAEAYALRHKEEMSNHVLAFESDMGVTDLIGFGFTGGNKGFEIVSNIMKGYFSDMKSDTLERDEGDSSDINILNKKFNIPIMKNLIKDTSDKEFYFTYYHSQADNMSVLNPDEMDRNVSGIASLFYILADSTWRFPRN